MYTSDTEKTIKTGMIYLAASLIIAAAAAVYGLFSHGVYSYYMTYAFMIPLLLGAVPHLTAALRGMRQSRDCSAAPDDARTGMRTAVMMWNGICGEVQTAVVATLTVGSLLKGALDIYGTTNRLLIIYPVTTVLMVLAAAGRFLHVRSKRPGCGA